MFVRMPVSSDDSYVLVELFTEVALVSYLTLFSGYLPHSFRIFYSYNPICRHLLSVFWR